MNRDNVETVAVHITGRVQGVGYRLSTVRHAHMLGVKGWVQNNEDGSVRALIQGSSDQIDAMLQWMRVGPPAAMVRDIEHEVTDTERRYDRFEQH
jgi:acylphosphatase